MSILYGYYFEVDLQVCTIEIDVYMLCIGNDIACPMMYRYCVFGDYSMFQGLLDEVLHVSQVVYDCIHHY